MNSQGLWKERFLGYSQEMQKYLRYIFNGHLMFVMVIGLGGLGFYYSEWVKTLTADFPAAWIMAIVLGFFLTRSPIMTFLKEADVVFLLPLETKLRMYFKQSILLSAMMQGFILIIVYIVFLPMYTKVTELDSAYSLFLIILLLAVKYLNIHIHWYTLKYTETSVIKVDFFIRLLVNIVLLYLVFAKASQLGVILCLLLGGLFIYYRNATIKKGVKWERLIELEGKRMMSFYRIANLFTDVPKLRGKVARRKWLDWLFTFIPYRQSSTYTFLYARTMLRANDYVGLLVRLTVIGSFVLLTFPSIIASILVTILFLYMTGIQILPVWKQHELKIWVSLYPLPAKLRETAVIQLVSSFLLFEAIVFAFVLLIAGNWQGASASFLASIVFLLIFRGYSAKKIRSF
ncbi:MULTISPECIES: ABC transporter permease [Bacillaceae]|uniref:ABC-2 type transport system permease protein n=1 Tax=Peribacillus huizhouensis TaxID=1501239 RepID=A0ABR6CJL4_9BACI|nr:MULTISPECIES: ABC transporter permease [Bacillaceae]MBA9025261.1 ABC-2 type transport system permease protein [Peribacillus huizhouensis]